MVHANAFAPETRFSEDNQALSGRDHFLHVMEIEPATDERLAQNVCVRLLQRRFENLFPAAKSTQRSLRYLSAKTNRHVALFVGKGRKLMSIFVTPRIMRQQIFRRLEAKPMQREQTRPRNPIQFSQQLRNFDHLGSARVSQQRTFILVIRSITRSVPPRAALP